MININYEIGFTSMIAFMTSPAPFTIAIDGCWKTGDLTEALTGPLLWEVFLSFPKLPGRV